MEPENPSEKQIQEEPPPFLGRWARVYAAVLGYLFLLITSLYVLTRVFAF